MTYNDVFPQAAEEAKAKAEAEAAAASAAAAAAAKPADAAEQSLEVSLGSYSDVCACVGGNASCLS